VARFGTDPRIHAESIGQLVDVNAPQFAIHFPGPDQKNAVDRFESDVVPTQVDGNGERSSKMA
jgi:hypothetical protein